MVIHALQFYLNRDDGVERQSQFPNTQFERKDFQPQTHTQLAQKVPHAEGVSQSLNVELGMLCSKPACIRGLINAAMRQPAINRVPESNTYSLRLDAAGLVNPLWSSGRD